MVDGTMTQEEVDKARRRAQLGNGRSARMGGDVVLDAEVVPMDTLPAYYRLAENKRYVMCVCVCCVWYTLSCPWCSTRVLS